MSTRLRSSDVFINCPFDPGFRPIFDAIVFSVHYLGFAPRCSLEDDDAAEFRLSKIERIIEECRESVAWLTREGARHGVPIERLVVAGHSAGGHLAAMLFATDWAAHGVPAGAIVAGVAISGVFDLEPLVQASFNTDLRLDPAKARAASPVYLTPRVRAPLLLAAGANETGEFIRQSWLLWEHWPECHPSGRKGPLFVPERHHFSIVSDLGDPGSELVTSIRLLCGGS